MKKPYRVPQRVKDNKLVGNTMQLSVESQKAVLTYMQSCIQRFDFATRRQIYQRIDQAIQLESATRRNLGKNRDQRLDYYDDTEVSVVTQAVDTVKGFLVDLFLAKPYIFEAVAPNKDDQQIAQQVDAVNERDSKDYSWARNFAILFGDLAKYNKCATEVEWDTQLSLELQRDNRGASTRIVAEVPRSGNRIKRCDIYNVFHDELVDAAEVHRYGEFVGYTEKITMVELVRRIKVMKAQNKVVMNDMNCFKSVAGETSDEFFKPSIVTEAPQNDAQGTGWGGNWTDFFAHPNENTKAPKANPTDSYLWTVVYARAIPSLFGIKELPQSHTVHMVKMIKVGGTLVSFERLNSIHNYLPMIISMIKEEGIGEQVKSDAALVIPLQNLATKLYDARLRSLAQATGNKYAYVEGLVDTASLSHPTAPIMVKPNLQGKDPLNAVKQLPFTDQLGSYFHQEIAFLKQSASEITRLNRAQMGQFQKGNKTASEFNEIMANADSDLRTYGLMFENVVMEPIKTIIRSNIAQFQEAEEITTTLGDKVEVNPLVLSQKVINFKLADGLAKKETLASLDPLINAYNQMLTSPKLEIQFDTAGLYVYINELMGAKISQFRLTPPEGQGGTPAPSPETNNPQAGNMPAQTPVR